MAKKLTEHARKLSFIGLADANPDDAVELWTIISRDIDSILVDFYDHLTDFAPKKLQKKLDVPSLSARQKEHWKRLFTSYYAKEYVKSAERAGHAHDVIGLAADWYIGAYAFFAVRMEALILDFYANDLATAKARLNLLTRLIALDQAIVMGVYQGDH